MKKYERMRGIEVRKRITVQTINTELRVNSQSTYYLVGGHWVESERQRQAR